MELRTATDAELALAYRRDLQASFPVSELPPLRAIRALIRAGTYRPWCLFDGEELAGEAFVFEPEPGFALFDYLCVAKERRNGGLGSLLIEKLLETERGNIVFGESEIPAYAPDKELAERRLAFYERNGARRADYDLCLFGVPFHTLYWAEKNVSDEALCAVHRRAWSSRLPAPVCRKYVRIPWEPSMGVPQVHAWME